MMGTNDEDPRLQLDIALAAGLTAFSLFPISDLMQHAKYFPLDKKIQIDQYSARLAAYYTEHGAPITAFSVANITGYDEMGMKAAHNLVRESQSLDEVAASTEHVKW